MLALRLALFAQEKPVATDWFQAIIQGGSFAVIVFIILFSAYFLVYEWPKIRKEQRDEREAERKALSADREADRNSRQAMVQAFQITLTDNTKAHIDAYKEQRTTFNDMVIRLEEKWERGIDKIITAWEKQIERVLEYMGDQIQTAVCRANNKGE